MSTPKATHTGTLFDGLVDCYVLEDGQRVLSQKGTVRALKGSEHSSGTLTQYLSRLPSRYAHLQGATVLDFRTPTGPAKGITPETLSEVLDAYVDAFMMGELHTQQAHLARNARRIQAAAAKIGWTALIDEATGYQEVRKANELSFAFRAILLESKCDWDMMHTPELADAMMRLKGKRYEGGPHPRELASTYHKLYVVVLGEEVVAELKRRNPAPVHGTNHHQWLTPEAREVFRRQIPIIIAIAGVSDSKEDFWVKLDHHFRGAMLQISLPGAAE